MAVTHPYMYKGMYLGSMSPEQAELILNVRQCEEIPNLEKMIFNFPPELVKQSIDEQISIRDIIKRDGIDYTIHRKIEKISDSWNSIYVFIA